MDKLKQTLLEIISEVSQIPVNQLDDNENIYEELGLDSFQLISIISKTEKAFSINIPMSVRDIQTISEYHTFVKSLIE